MVWPEKTGTLWYSNIVCKFEIGHSQVLITRPNPVPSFSLTSNALEDRNSKDMKIQDLDRDLDPLEDREDLIPILSL